MKKIEFSAKLEKHPNIDATFVKFPFDVFELFGTKGQVKVKATIDGALYRGSLANMGMGCHILGVTQVIRKQIGKSAGDSVKVVLEKDLEERIIEVPKDLALLLKKNKKASNYFDTLSYTNRKEYVVWIESAKKEETREARLKGTIEKLQKGLKNPTQK
jgi:hypothetical protein